MTYQPQHGMLFADFMKTHAIDGSWSFIKVDDNDNVRLYYQVRPDPVNDFESKLRGCGFDFHVVELYEATGHPENEDGWHPDHCGVDNVVRGSALFDGIRHMWWGKYDEGYLNYPECAILIKILTHLDALERQHCGQSDNPRIGA